MNKRVLYFIGLSSLILLLAILSVTGIFPPSSGIGNPTVKEILKGNSDADIFKLDGLVYSNATDSEWIKDEDYTMGEKIGEIKKQTTNTFWYRNFYATKLPEGTVLYAANDKGYTKGDAPRLVVVEQDNEILVYHALVEG